VKTGKTVCVCGGGGAGLCIAEGSACGFSRVGRVPGGMGVCVGVGGGGGGVTTGPTCWCVLLLSWQCSEPTGTNARRHPVCTLCGSEEGPPHGQLQRWGV